MKRIALNLSGVTLAVVVAFTTVRGGQQIPPGIVLKQNLKNFTLQISYQGPERKQPLHNITLSVVPPPPAAAAGQKELYAQLNEKQAGKVIDALVAGRDLAKPWPQQNGGPAIAKTGYLVVAQTGGAPPVGYQNGLGFDLNTLLHFDAIRAALDGEPAKQMDRVLDDLKDVRKQWTEEGRVFDRDGLALFVKPPADAFGPGKPVIFDIKLRNTTAAPLTLAQDPANITHWIINIHGPNSEEFSASRQGPRPAGPAKSVTIKANDSLAVQLSLAPCHYFAKPKTFPAKMVALDNLPPGKYTFELSAELTEQPPFTKIEHAPYWSGGEPITTPIPITVGAAAKPK